MGNPNTCIVNVIISLNWDRKNCIGDKESALNYISMLNLLIFHSFIPICRSIYSRKVYSFILGSSLDPFINREIGRLLNKFKYIYETGYPMSSVSLRKFVMLNFIFSFIHCVYFKNSETCILNLILAISIGNI